MTKLPMLSTDEKVAEIRRLYFTTTRDRVQEDLAKALDILKSMHSEDERERATVYMEGLAQMRSDWGLNRKEKVRGQRSEVNGQRSEVKGQRSKVKGKGPKR